MTPDTLSRPAGPADAAQPKPVERWLASAHGLMARVPESAIALLGRLSVAAMFRKSGQTKIEGLAIDIVSGTFELGIPRLSSSAVDRPSSSSGSIRRRTRRMASGLPCCCG